jgi:hypothetical protein
MGLGIGIMFLLRRQQVAGYTAHYATADNAAHTPVSQHASGDGASTRAERDVVASSLPKAADPGSTKRALIPAALARRVKVKIFVAFLSSVDMSVRVTRRRALGCPYGICG